MNSNGDRHFDANEANGEPLDAQPDASQLAEARLTAYVLGELADDDLAAVEKELAESEAVRQQVHDMGRSVEMLTAALATEPIPKVPAEQHGRCIDADNRPEPLPIRISRPSRPQRASFRRLLLVASLLLCIGIGLRLISPAMWPSRDVAWHSSVKPAGSSVQKKVGTYRTQLDDRAASRYRSSAREITYPETTRNSIQSEHSGYFIGAHYPESRTVSAVTGPKASNSPSDAGGLNLASNGNATHDLTDGRYTPGGWQSGRERGLPNLPRIMIQEEEAPKLLSGERHNTESYDRIDENPFLDVRQNPLSTFSIDVDTASYANVRRFLNAGALPPKDAVRIEEMLNYFTYHYAPPTDDKQFAVLAEVAGCPWEPKHRLLRIALKGREIDMENRPASNLVFLIDVSGSMDQPAKLPLLKNALRLLIGKLAENDRVAMVVYAGSSGLVLPSTSGLYRDTILAALDQLQAGGSTNGGSGVQLAYSVAREKFVKGGTNRVVLCTDGDFNVGLTDQGSLTRLIEDEAKSGVFLSVLGFGAGNLNDSTMEQLADRGNGNYAYIDSLQEARKVLVEQLGGTLVTIAKDVKLQLEFNPRQVSAYRLIGYENRLLRAEDFNDDKKDAGEIGAGLTVTALYELAPAGEDVPAARADELKYQRVAEPDGAVSDELLTLKLRYKEPDGDTSQLIEHVVKDAGMSYAQATEDFRFVAAVACFGLILRDSQYKGNLTWDAVRELAEASRGSDEQGYRREMIGLVKKAQSLSH